MRKTKKKDKRAIFLLILLFLLLAAALVLSLQIRTVTVKGNVRCSSKQIEDAIFEAPVNRNSVFTYFQYRFRPHKQIPFVEDYKIVFRSPSEVEIITYEKSVVGYVSYMNSLMYFDKDGIIVESTNEQLEGIPLVTGLKFGHIVLHRPLPIENDRVFEETLNLTQLLSMAEIGVDEIHYNSSLEAQLAIGNLKVVLGNNTNMNGKISELNDILESYSDLDGTLYLDSYDDNNPKPMYRFQKR